VSSFLRKIFRRGSDQKPSFEDHKNDHQVAPPVQEEEVPTDPFTKAAGINPPQFLVGCGHSVGLHRDHNEDAIFTLNTTLVSNSDHSHFGLYIVADGMGGHLHGEQASEIAIRAMSSYIIRNLYTPLFSPSAAPPGESLQEIMQEAIRLAHRAILKEAPGGGSTLTCGLILGEQLTITHIGDSRAYLIYPDDRIEALTRDHSLVQRLIDLGQISAEEASIHPHRNVVYKALGQGEAFEAEVTTRRLTSGHLLICSDGLWGLVSEEEMVEIIRSNTHPILACQELVDAANAAGGPDNISVILIRIPD
jgi:PPM family protein phosphatase